MLVLLIHWVVLDNFRIYYIYLQFYHSSTLRMWLPVELFWYFWTNIWNDSICLIKSPNAIVLTVTLLDRFALMLVLHRTLYPLTYVVPNIFSLSSLVTSVSMLIKHLSYTCSNDKSVTVKSDLISYLQSVAN